MTRPGFLALGMTLAATLSAPAAGPRPGEKLVRKGDEIIVCGQFFHTGTPVVTWMDPGGYDAYRVDRRFGPAEKAAWAAIAKEPGNRAPSRFGVRKAGMSPEDLERVRGGWDLPTLQKTVDQFVLHYDACGTSKTCFRVLHDERFLSVQFMLDLDGTIYQTLDLKEAAWHATKANGRSVGIEIANIGAEAADRPDTFSRWYKAGPDGSTLITVPGPAESNGIRNKAIPLRPIRPEPVVGTLQGRTLKQYDLTPEQYGALIRLTATLHAVFPKIKLDYPRDAKGALLTRKIDDDAYATYEGVLGHFHVQTNKIDPGPAFQWDRLIRGAKEIGAGE